MSQVFESIIMTGFSSLIIPFSLRKSGPRIHIKSMIKKEYEMMNHLVNFKGGVRYEILFIYRCRKRKVYDWINK